MSDITGGLDCSFGGVMRVDGGPRSVGNCVGYHSSISTTFAFSEVSCSFGGGSSIAFSCLYSPSATTSLITASVNLLWEGALGNEGSACGSNDSESSSGSGNVGWGRGSSLNIPGGVRG